MKLGQICESFVRTVVHCSSITLKEMFFTEVNSSKTNLVKPHLTLICTLNLFNQFTRATECEVQLSSCQAYLQCKVELGVLVFLEGGKPENPEKNPRSKDENQQQTQPTCDARSGNRTRAKTMRRALSPLRH